MTGRRIEGKDLYKLTQMRHLAIAKVICIVMYWVGLRRRNNVNRVMSLEGERVRTILFDGVVTHDSGPGIVRLSAEAFMGLCNILVRYGGLRPTIRVNVEEQVAKSLYVLAHGVTNQALRFFFDQSKETNSRHFHNILRAILEVEDRFLIQPNGYEVPGEIFSNSRYYPFLRIVLGLLMEHTFM
ncbi:unnamed protein product [Cuscuta europaea]|uniref:DUF8040 domain-containing protein n=1 Tax=Cuscuta europaea TaxID=41803 RepID=A0A9P1E9S0_CUSEU|nr:unnamed protein product [Cuscuta europaea]